MSRAPQPLDHVRRPAPPWRIRQYGVTECGRPIVDIAGDVITRDELVARVRQQGQARSAFTTCMTCWQRCRYQRSWETEPMEVIRRWTDQPDDEAVAEARALRALVTAHAEEFELLVASHMSDELADRRQARRTRRTAQ